MAKALIGHLGGPTLEQAQETARLRRRVADLEAEVARLSAENDGLLRSLSARVDEVTSRDLFEPAAG